MDENWKAGGPLGIKTSLRKWKNNRNNTNKTNKDTNTKSTKKNQSANTSGAKSTTADNNGGGPENQKAETNSQASSKKKKNKKKKNKKKKKNGDTSPSTSNVQTSGTPDHLSNAIAAVGIAGSKSEDHRWSVLVCCSEVFECGGLFSGDTSGSRRILCFTNTSTLRFG